MKKISVKKSVLSWTLLAVLFLGTVFSGAGTLKAQAAAQDTSVNAYNSSYWKTVDQSYLQDAILIGNSRMKGFVLYSGVPNLQAVVGVGWRVADYATKKKIAINGKKYTGPEAIRLFSFNKAYINFGLNDLTDKESSFVANYKAIIEDVKSVNPNAVIYINSILPVNPSAKKKYPKVNQARIDTLNADLRQLAIDEGCVYLDTASVFKDDSGHMADGLTSDGVHVNQASMYLWRDFWLTHAVTD
ncbi:MAG: GDSL-type esterase/lipase family protein [Lachnospiraceae bacterium]